MRGLTLSVVVFSALMTAGASAQVVQSADGLVVGGKASPGAVPLDYLHAKPQPLPRAVQPPPSQLNLLTEAAKAPPAQAPVVVPGIPGSGNITVAPVVIPVPLNQALSPEDAIGPQEYGASGQVYNTTRAPNGGNISPYYRTGKLYFQEPTGTYVCSASLIKPGVLVTAAHCVAKYGQSQLYSGWTFYPAYNNGYAPYGAWTAAGAYVLTSYYNGTDSCYQSGVICQDDIAVIILNSQNGATLGSMIGTYGYGTGGYSFKNGQALIGQLGYPVALDSGTIMQLNFSQGSTNATYSNNTIIGSLMTGGSSGGPWLVNLGKPPVLSSGTGFGTDSLNNIVVGVTSWGYTDTSSSGNKQMGASAVTTSNITPLLNSACSFMPSAC